MGRFAVDLAVPAHLGFHNRWAVSSGLSRHSVCSVNERLSQGLTGFFIGDAANVSRPLTRGATPWIGGTVFSDHRSATGTGHHPHV